MRQKEKPNLVFPLLEHCEVLKRDALSPELHNAVCQLPRKNQINIMRDRDLHSVIVTKSGNLLAGLWTSWRAERFAFDVVVESAARGNGFAKHLVHHAVSDFNETRNTYADPMMVIDVVNPAMRCLLEEHFGFSVALQRAGQRWEMIPPTNDEGAVILPEAGTQTFSA